ncbi:MAG: GNAT family N-acetyltransferase [Proteobacteria bacterium]|nr:GNAT family N-acetyltransferase [Pseudomonadota bacterium]
MRKTSAPSIRPATERDLPAIARVLVDTWRSTFQGILPDSFLSALSYPEQEERHRRRMRQPENQHLVIEDTAGTVVGFANSGRSRLVEYPHLSELYAIYILADHQARGLGRRLVGAVARALIVQGRSRMLVRALEANPCRAFYEHLGAERLGMHSLAMEDFAVPAIDYGWDNVRQLAGLREVGSMGE